MLGSRKNRSYGVSEESVIAEKPETKERNDGTQFIPVPVFRRVEV